VSRRKPFTLAERRAASHYVLGRRPTNDWGDGDLPAPWAEGDVVRLRDDARLSREFLSRLDMSVRGRQWWSSPRNRGYFVVSCAWSIDEGDAWYFRVRDGEGERASDRLHVAYRERCTWKKSIDFMAPFDLVETADPEGLAVRERMLAAGWECPRPR